MKAYMSLFFFALTFNFNKYEEINNKYLKSGNKNSGTPFLAIRTRKLMSRMRRRRLRIALDKTGGKA
jgi:hypothetical protein